MDPLPRKSISSVPKFANGTPLAFVIDSFLVRTPNYAISHGDRSHLMLTDKFKYLTGNARIGADVATLHSRNSSTSAFSDGTMPTATLCRMAQVRAVEGNRCIGHPRNPFRAFLLRRLTKRFSTMLRFP